MKFTIATAAAVLAGSASAASFAVNNFAASCTPHSTFCQYSFDATTPYKSETQCEKRLQGPDRLPAVEAADCKNGVAWKLARTADGGFDLTLTNRLDSRSNATGIYHVPADQIETVNGGAVQTERYVGPANFTVELSTA